VVLPPKLARLIEDQLREATTLHRQPQRERYLFPGQIPGRPRNPVGLGDTMKRHNLPARAARNTAVMEALADLPPIVISEPETVTGARRRQPCRRTGETRRARKGSRGVAGASGATATPLLGRPPPGVPCPRAGGS
jgi:hypothetical protein